MKVIQLILIIIQSIYNNLKTLNTKSSIHITTKRFQGSKVK